MGYRCHLNSKSKGLAKNSLFYIGKHFCIRGGDEQKRLGPSHFIRSSDRNVNLDIHWTHSLCNAQGLQLFHAVAQCCFTGVCTIFILCCLISLTIPITSTTPSFACSRAWSKAINDPVRPTPVLQKTVLSLIVLWYPRIAIQSCAYITLDALPAVNNDRAINQWIRESFLMQSK